MILILTTSVILFAINYYQAQQEKNNHFLTETLFHQEIRLYVTNLYKFSDTLEMYEATFSEEEEKIYRQALNNISNNLNNQPYRIHAFLTRLYAGENRHRKFRDELHSLNLLLEDVSKITNHQQILDIATVLKEKALTLEQIFALQSNIIVESFDAATKEIEVLNQQIRKISGL
ncbi:hypothetical protein BKP35_16170 [Anaerobacillus arseniciselenatis]|uniref:Uncharacterized protein n=1 Tax=Anaerobacillus arseniciselenatis TaxID=85682 RepID=A0A1S2LBB0_9BACI|nr:hypothetical protein [Anaerobacillus arseniciselenatis]OIJ09691.1 hypothetical protein BKP35_16170 [Anaerobacillus arseniciselenatis]